MKITCQSCQAKYTIADDKVVGKTVKIKCKKCGSAIVVHGNEGAPNAGYDAGAQAPGADGGDDNAATRVLNEGGGSAPGMGADEWVVNIAEGDERTMSTIELATEFARGTLSHDTYVWKEGMGDWLPIASVPELQPYIAKQAPAASAVPDNPLGMLGTVVMDDPMRAPGNPSPMAAAAPRPVSSPPPAQQAAAAPAAAARRAGNRGAGVDLFGAAGRTDGTNPASAPPPAGGLNRSVGERNENSVLFSLSALSASTGAGGPQEEGILDMRPSNRPSPAARPGATNRPAPAAANNGGRAGLDDIMSMGGGGIASPMLAPPPLLAPVVEAPPPPPPVYTPMASPGMASIAIPEYPQKKSSLGVILGAVAALAVVGGVAVFFLTQKPEETTAPTTTEQAATAPTTPSAAPSDTGKVAEAPPADTGTPAAGTADTAAAVNTGAKPPPVGGAPVGGPGPGKQPEKAGEKPPPEKTAEAPTPPPEKTAETPPPPAGGSGEFNRGAAQSALGSAAGAAKSCKKPDGPTGTGKVKVTFAPSGSVTSAQVQGAPFAGTPVGGCVAGVFRGARVPPFDGAPVTVNKSFTIN